ncbi:MAG: DinB family protein [Anaerolineales bacterium]
MTLTLLLDLDDTLLNTNLTAFVPAYFQALAKELAPQLAPDIMFRALIAGTSLMNESDDFSRSLREVFDSVFYSQLTISREAIEPAIENFYDNVFPTLGSLTTQIPEAKEFVEWAIAKGYRIAIATDPLFPRKATYHRVRWAGFDPEQFELISSYEHFHFSKTHPAYYAEVLGRMGWPEGPILMVGNDLERDIAPSKKLGLAAFHVDVESTSSLRTEAEPRGNLTDLRHWLETIDFASLMPSFKTRESVLSLLSATPATLNGMLRDLDSTSWSLKSTHDEWSLTELICHLRDTEREIHHMQIRLFKDQNEPFIPRPDTSVWASQRDYLHEDGALALKEFNDARRETIDLLKNISTDDWERKARHAIFGPTNFLEVVSFFADHDRMHVQQAWTTLRKM